MNDALEFVKAAVDRPREVATLFPTFAPLSARLAETVKPGEDGLVVELGPGSGAITRHLVPRLGNPGRFVGVEINGDLVQVLAGRFPDLRFVRAPAQELAAHVPDGAARNVVASLPWTLFAPEEQAATVAAAHRALGPGGILATFICINAQLFPGARRLVGLLRDRFSSLERGPVEWRNLPPAMLYVARV